MTQIVLNGQPVEADPKKPLIAACHDNGAEVPHYCYHPGLSPVGSCRICQVEVRQGEMPPRVVVACRTPVAEGMVVDTESPKAHETRRECLEFLLKNHPLDCPICDKAGECDLQDYAFQEGQGEGRTVEPRRKLEKRHSLGDTIVLDQERCILCSRCVRFFEEVTKKPQLTVGRRGSASVIETFMDRPLEGNYQGNIADLCPVGALTLSKFRFRARVWNLLKAASTCGECSRGCATTVEALRGGEVVRIRPRHDPEVNGWWMCDVGRFAWDEAGRPERLGAAAVRGARGLEPRPGDEALALLANTLVAWEGPLLVASPFLTQEEAQRLLKLGERVGARPVFVSPPANELADDLLHTGDPCPNRRGLTELGLEGLDAGAVLERAAAADCVLLVGERVARLVGGADALRTLPESTRLVLFDTHGADAPALRMTVGVPNWTERTGTWINVDGHRGLLSAVTPAPHGVAPLVRTLDRLLQALPAAEVGAR